MWKVVVNKQFHEPNEYAIIAQVSRYVSHHIHVHTQLNGDSQKHKL